MTDSIHDAIPTGPTDEENEAARDFMYEAIPPFMAALADNFSDFAESVERANDTLQKALQGGDEDAQRVELTVAPLTIMLTWLAFRAHIDGLIADFKQRGQIALGQTPEEYTDGSDLTGIPVGEASRA